MSIKRGMLTDRVKTKALELGLKELTQEELRLMPYVQYLAVNSERLDPRRINKTERAILSEWRKAGFIKGGASSEILPTKEFWNIMHELMWLAYVNISEPEPELETTRDVPL